MKIVIVGGVAGELRPLLVHVVVGISTNVKFERGADVSFANCGDALLLGARDQDS